MNERARNDYESIYDRAADAELMARFMRGELQPAEKPKAEIPVVHSLPRGAMTSAEVKERLGVSAARVSKLISSGKLEAVSYCGRKYVTPEALAEYRATGRKPGRPMGYSPVQGMCDRYLDAVADLARRENAGRGLER